MKKALIIMTFSAMAAGCADNSITKAQPVSYTHLTLPTNSLV